jgi:heavy metal translocating P-type ATPase
VILMLSGGQALENYATRRASSVLRALAQRMPTKAHLVSDNSYEDVAVDHVRPGDLLFVFPHEICPVDGEVAEGHGRMDESFLTGEPFELSKAPGAQVISGAVNGDAMLTIRALRFSGDSKYARILKVIQETEQNQPHLRRIGDRLGAWYTPVALGLAALGWLISGSPQRFLAVSVIATPCPLLLAIPVAILGGISLAARRGIVVRNATVLEQIDSCKTFIFDKTGTLTYGRPNLTEIYCSPGHRENQALSAAASLETYSRHPLAKGILEAAKKKKITIYSPSHVTEHPGDGLRGTVQSRKIHITGRKKAENLYGPLRHLPPPSSGLECLLFVDGKFAALLKFQDEPKEDSSPFINHLSPKHHAKRIILLSGDKENEVRHMASLVGISEIYFGKSPEEKLAFVQNETQKAKTVFVGDGINDAPAMLAASVGIALGGTSEAISESADAVVLDSSLRKIDEFIHLGRRMKRIALQSAVGGMLLSGIGMIAAATGHLSPLNGAIAQEIIDLAAVLNALRVTMPTADLADF